METLSHHLAKLILKKFLGLEKSIHSTRYIRHLIAVLMRWQTDWCRDRQAGWAGRPSRDNVNISIEILLSMITFKCFPPEKLTRVITQCSDTEREEEQNHIKYQEQINPALWFHCASVTWPLGISIETDSDGNTNIISD